jgi:uracil-DNA glycosylase family 4
MFTGDSSGAWLYGALHRAGIANRPDSVSRDDGLALRGAFVTAACRCAPPGNRPSPAELAACASFLDRELDLLGEPRVILALGRIAWDTAIRRARRADPAAVPRPAPAFGHGAEVSLTLRSGGPPALLLGCYHPSRQNTQTGRLTRAMFESMILRTARAAGLAPAASRRSRKGGRTKTRMKSRGAWEDA